MADVNRNPGRFRIWPRFTLRLLLLAITVICVWLAIHTQRARRQQRIVEHVEINSGRVRYDFDPASPRPPTALPAMSPVPRWLLDRFGVDFFHGVVAVEIRTPDDLSQVCKLDMLRELTIANSGTNDDDVLQIARLGNLRVLTIRPGDGNAEHRPTRITDRALETIRRMPGLRSVELYGDDFSPAAIEGLAQCKSLESIHLVGCRADVTSAAALPFKSSRRVQQLELARWPLYLYPHLWTPQKDLIESW